MGQQEVAEVRRHACIPLSCLERNEMGRGRCLVLLSAHAVVMLFESTYNCLARGASEWRNRTAAGARRCGRAFRCPGAPSLLTPQSSFQGSLSTQPVAAQVETWQIYSLPLFQTYTSGI